MHPFAIYKRFGTCQSYSKPKPVPEKKYYTFENKEVERKFGLKHLDLRPKQSVSLHKNICLHNIMKVVYCRVQKRKGRRGGAYSPEDIRKVFLEHV